MCTTEDEPDEESENRIFEAPTMTTPTKANTLPAI